MIRRVRRRFWLLYPAWIALCAALFFGLRGARDPSRPAGRILSNDAATLAVKALGTRDFPGYEVVHVAYAPASEPGNRARWVVLCDRLPHTALRQAVVVELDARDGRVLTIRSPVR